MMQLPDLAGVQAAGIWAALAACIIALFKSRPATMQIEAASDASLRSDLLARMQRLEDRVATLEREKAEMQVAHQGAMTELREQFLEERHHVDTLLLLIEEAPDKLDEVAPKIRDARKKRA